MSEIGTKVIEDSDTVLIKEDTTINLTNEEMNIVRMALGAYLNSAERSFKDGVINRSNFREIEHQIALIKSKFTPEDKEDY